MADYQTFLKEKGYFVAKNFLPKQIIQQARQEIEALFEHDQDNTLKPTTFLTSNFLNDVVVCNPFLNILKELVSSTHAITTNVKKNADDYKFFVPNFTVRRDLYIDWHSDDEFVEPDDGELPAVLQCNIYLQDNCTDHGGGIDVSLGTHRLPQNAKKTSIQKNGVIGTTIETKAGDLLVFDYRVVHRGTIPLISPRKESRLAIQWTVCKSLEDAQKFFAYLLRRVEQKLHRSDFTDKRSLAYFQDIKDFSLNLPNVANYFEKLKKKGCHLLMNTYLEQSNDKICA